MKIKSALNKIERAVKFELIEPKLNSPIKCVTKNKSRQAMQHRQKDIRLGFVGSGDVWRWVKEQKRKNEHNIGQEKKRKEKKGEKKNKNEKEKTRTEKNRKEQNRKEAR